MKRFYKFFIALTVCLVMSSLSYGAALVVKSMPLSQQISTTASVRVVVKVTDQFTGFDFGVILHKEEFAAGWNQAMGAVLFNHSEKQIRGYNGDIANWVFPESTKLFEIGDTVALWLTIDIANKTHTLHAQLQSETEVSTVFEDFQFRASVKGEPYDTANFCTVFVNDRMGENAAGAVEVFDDAIVVDEIVPFFPIEVEPETEGLFTLQADNLSKYMSGGTPGSPMPMIESVTDDAKFYIMENAANPGFYNIISLDQMYIASSTGAFGTLIENTEAHRDSAHYGALVNLIDQEGTYRLESTPGGETKGWNARRGGATQVGMGASSIAGYNWTLTRIGDLPGPNAAPTDIALSDTVIVENNIAGAFVGTLSATDADAGDTFTFMFEADTVNGVDNDAFTITDDALSLNESADYDMKSEYKINVKVTDAGDLSFVKAFTIVVNDFMETEGFTTDGIYTIHCKGKATFMSSDGEPGKPLPLQDSTRLGDDNKLYVVANPADTSKVNIITLDGRYVGSTTGSFGAWIENSVANRDSAIAAASLLEQATNEYFIETFFGVDQKLWNGQRNGSTAVGMGTSGNANYIWNLTRVGDMPAGNVAPTEIFLSVDNIDENNAANATVGMLSASDANPFDMHTYSLTAGDGTNDADNGAFTITDHMLMIIDTTDFETKASYSINIEVSDEGGLSFVKAFTISVNDVIENFAPTDIALSETSIVENNIAGAVVGMLSATDADAGDTFTFAFEADTVSGVDNDAFTITDDALSINESADYDMKSEYKINVKVTDAGDLSFVKAFTIVVNDFMESEGFTTDGIYTIHCKGKSTFMSSDGEPGRPLPLQDSTRLGDDNKLYVVTNPADTSKINIITLDGRYVGSVHPSGYGTWIENTVENRDSAIAAASLLEQATNEYFIETFLGVDQKLWNGQRNGSTAVGMGTSGNANYIWNLTRIGDMPAGNVAPTEIFLSVDSLDEGNAANATVGMLSASDANPFDTLTFSLGAGADNDAFMITDNMLTINDTADFDTKASYDITIKVTDTGGLSFDKAFTIRIIEIPENSAPTDIALSATAIDENNAAGAIVGTLSATDADEDDTFTFTFEEDATDGADNDAFTITGDALSMNASADFETKSEFKVNVKVSDAGDSSFVKSFTITVNDVNEAPTAIALSAESIAENAAVGTVVGTLSATDADANSTLTYTLGGADAASFSIVDDSLKSAEMFDFETKASYSITVTVSDGDLTFNQDFTISILDAIETSVGAIELSNVSFYPNPVRNTLTVSGLSVEATAYVYTVNGTLVKVAQVSAIEKSIDVSELSSGTYIFKLTVDGGELVTKIVK